jgi:hypothetical protein
MPSSVAPVSDPKTILDEPVCTLFERVSDVMKKCFLPKYVCEFDTKVYELDGQKTLYRRLDFVDPVNKAMISVSDKKIQIWVNMRSEQPRVFHDMVFYCFTNDLVVLEHESKAFDLRMDTACDKLEHVLIKSLYPTLKCTSVYC